ncbi:cutinase [Stachybotrys elegans]|uniref:Cutinase n=1 Tax=Stachybotrys elegans TaxID=80388 RepID=A0A8K0SBY1_9HYPO|nr:cutinase [Stachybotrys elegans]
MRFFVERLALVAGIASAQGIQCTDGLKMFLARGTTEPLGTGLMTTITRQIEQLIPGSTTDDIPYPATLFEPTYFVSVLNGSTLLQEAVSEYAAACPDGKMALMGYSQGAQVVGNAICGAGYAWSAGTILPLIPGAPPITEPLPLTFPPLPTNVTENVVAVIFFGDPTRQPGASWNRGSASPKNRGGFNRDDSIIQYCERYGPRMRSYCDDGDSVCDDGTVSRPEPHISYVQNYGDEVVEHLVAQYNSH